MTTDDLLRPRRSEQCTATSKRTSRRCGQLVPGGGVCMWHGGAAGQVARQREARLAAAEAQAMYADEFGQRDAGEVLVAAVADVDGIVQKLKARIREAGELKPSDLDALGEWLDRASRMARSVLDARVDERRVRVNERQGELVAAVLKGALSDLSAMLAAGQIATVDPAQPAVMRVVASRLRELAA